MSRPTLALAVALLALACGGAGAAPPLMIHGDRSLAGFRMAGSPAEASRAFGAPASGRDLRGLSCRAVWPALGLTVSFLAFEGHPCRDGAAVQATVTGRAWLTEKGLRVGAAEAETRRLYPAARLERGAPFAGLWLVRRRACTEVGGEPFPGLLARLARGRVSALVVTAGVCD